MLRGTSFLMSGSWLVCCRALIVNMCNELTCYVFAWRTRISINLTARLPETGNTGSEVVFCR